jgi:hypothetical protein
MVGNAFKKSIGACACYPGIVVLSARWEGGHVIRDWMDGWIVNFASVGAGGLQASGMFIYWEGLWDVWPRYIWFCWRFGSAYVPLWERRTRGEEGGSGYVVTPGEASSGTLGRGLLLVRRLAVGEADTWWGVRRRGWPSGGALGSFGPFAACAVIIVVVVVVVGNKPVSEGIRGTVVADARKYNLWSVGK